MHTLRTLVCCALPLIASCAGTREAPDRGPHSVFRQRASTSADSIEAPYPYGDLPDDVQIRTLVLDSLAHSEERMWNVALYGNHALELLMQSEKDVPLERRMNYLDAVKRITDSLRALPPESIPLEICINTDLIIWKSCCTVEAPDQRDDLAFRVQQEKLAQFDAEFLDVYCALDHMIARGDTITPAQFHSQHRYRLLSEAECSAQPTVFDRPIMGISPVSFNASHTRCCVVTTWFCGGLCGEGQMWFFRKDGTRWRLVKRVQDWVS